jgi:hypothetical protein
MNPSRPISSALAGLVRERAIITDYRSAARPAMRPIAPKSLQLTIYAMAWQAMTGALPAEVRPRLSRLGRTRVDGRAPRRRAKIRPPPRIRRAFEPTPALPRLPQPLTSPGERREVRGALRAISDFGSAGPGDATAQAVVTRPPIVANPSGRRGAF